MLNDELKKEQVERAYQLYMTTVVRDIANASYHGKYEREPFQELLQRIEGGTVRDERSADSIIQSLVDRL